jgi:hypothetical protein
MAAVDPTIELHAMVNVEPCVHLEAGYPKLSERMALLPQLGIFRSFGALKTLNLLYLQAELIEVEKELREIQKCDSQSSDKKRAKYHIDSYWLRESIKSTDVESSIQWRLILKCRALMKEYGMEAFEPRCDRSIANYQ